MSNQYNLGKDDEHVRGHHDDREVDEWLSDHNCDEDHETPALYNPAKKVVEYSAAAVFMAMGLYGVHNHIEYAGWAIFLAIIIAWD